MTAQLPVTSDVIALTAAVFAAPECTTTPLVLADAITETTGDYAAALTAARIEQAKGLLAAKTKAGSKLRGALARRAGATNVCGRALSCVSFAVVAGDAKPTYEGSSWHYETTTGRVIHYPNAYKRVAKSAELIYVPASHVVTVGAEWLLANLADLIG